MPDTSAYPNSDPSTVKIPPDSKYAHLSELHPDFAAIKPIVDAENETLWQLPFEEVRAAMRPKLTVLLPDQCPMPGEDYTTTDETFKARYGASIGMRFYRPLEGKQNKAGVWVENRFLAAADYMVASEDYRLAPEHKFPVGVHDCFDGLKRCIDNADRFGFNKERIVTAGGSAGGSLAIVMALMARDQGVKGVQGVVANIPSVCIPPLFPKDKYEYNSLEQNGNASIIHKGKCLWFLEQYISDPFADMGEKTEYHSPLLAPSLKDFPKTQLQIAGHDPLRDEGFAFSERLVAEGGDCKLICFPGLPHGFYGMPQFKESSEYHKNVVNSVNGIASNYA